MNKGKTQEYILKKSKKLFAQYGFNETTMAMIAEGVGIKKPSLYYFFKNKEDIYATLLGEILISITSILSHQKSNELIWTITEIFKVSKINGAFIFSVQKLSDNSMAKICPLVLMFEKEMNIYFSSYELRCLVRDAVMLVVDTSQSYARHVAVGQKVVSPKKYAELIVNLIQK